MPKQINIDVAAQALVDAIFSSDKEAAKKHEVSVRTIRRWRERAKYDEDLSLKVRELKNEIETAWIDTINPAIVSGVRYLQRAAKKANEIDAETIVAITGAVKAMSDVENNRRILDTLLTPSKTVPKRNRKMDA